MPRWEYKEKHISKTQDLQRIMNELGAEGWELVCYVESRIFVFKRQTNSLAGNLFGRKQHEL